MSYLKQFGPMAALTLLAAAGLDQRKLRPRLRLAPRHQT